MHKNIQLQAWSVRNFLIRSRLNSDSVPSEVKAEVVEAEDVIVVVVEAEAEVVVEAGKDGQFVLHQKIVLAAMKGKK